MTTLADLEQRYQADKIALVKQALEATSYNATQAGQLLGVRRTTVIKLANSDPDLSKLYDANKSGAGRPRKTTAEALREVIADRWGHLPGEADRLWLVDRVGELRETGKISKRESREMLNRINRLAR